MNREDDDSLIDELCDTLPERREFVYPRRVSGVGDPYRPAPTPKREWPANPPKVWVIPKFLLITLLAGVFLLGIIITLPHTKQKSLPTVSPTTVTTITASPSATQTGLPAVCAAAFTAIQRTLEANSTIASAGGEQLDLAHEAYRAMFLKDWAKLNDIMKRQTDLNNKLDKPANDALIGYAELVEMINECLRETKQ